MTTTLKRTERFAITSLVLGIISLILCFLGPLFAIPAIICGHVAKSKIKKNSDALTGNGMALAGRITGYVSIFMFLAVMSLPASHPNRAAARRAACKSNLHQMQLGLERYADANSGVYPKDIQELKRFMAGTATATDMNRLFSCPGRGNNEGNDYVMASDLSPDDPGTKDAIWEASVHNHGGKGRNVVSLNGSITFRKTWRDYFP
jgi:hypothetical protein